MITMLIKFTYILCDYKAPNYFSKYFKKNAERYSQNIKQIKIMLKNLNQKIEICIYLNIYTNCIQIRFVVF